METLLLFIGLMVALAVVIWGGRKVWHGRQAARFIEEANDVHGEAYSAQSVEARALARKRFEEMAIEAAKGKNRFLQTRDIGETMLGFAAFTVKMAREGNAPDVAAVEEWENSVRAHLAPLLYQKRIEDR